MNKRSDIYLAIVFGAIPLILVLLIFGFIYSAHHSIVRGLATFDAVWSSEAALASHLFENEGKWPKDWDDLQSAFTQNNIDLEHIGRIQQIVDIDFQFDTKCTIEDFSAISMRDGTSNGELETANERIRGTLRNAALQRPSDEGAAEILAPSLD